MIRRCKQCGGSIPPSKKPNAIFCHRNCQIGYNKRKKKFYLQLAQTKSEIEYLEAAIDEFKQYKPNQKKLAREISNIQKEIGRVKRQVRDYRRVLKLNQSDFETWLENHLDQFGADYPYECQNFRSKNRQHRDRLIENFRIGCRRDLNKATQQYNDLKNKLHALEDQRKGKVPHPRLEKFEQELEEQYEKLDELETVDPENLAPTGNERFTYNNAQQVNKSSANMLQGYSGLEILGMQFDSLELDGELGKFLGQLEREKCAIALTGNSGAGKSYFSFELAAAFRKVNQKVAYFSLESGFNQKFKELIRKYQLGDNRFKAFDEGGLEEVRKVASQFDVVIVDSYAKISSKAVDFENLRQDFPNTYFVIIFQKTTSGDIRGGSSILYNSTATIDIQISDQGHRMAFMQKSRYDVENFVYSINSNKVLKNDKYPISWPQIKEKWPLPIHIQA